MIKFTPLASSSAGCCYLLEGGGASRPLLLDAGLRFEEIQKATNFRVSQLDAVLITHCHGDHVKGLRKLYDFGSSIIAHSSVIEKVFGRVGAVEYREVKEGQPINLGSWIITPFEVPHDVPTFGFVIDNLSGSRCLYLTDAQFSPKRFEGLTHIFVEANYSPEIIRSKAVDGSIDMKRYGRTLGSHMSIQTTINLLKSNDLSRVQEIWLLHLSSANSDAEGFKRAVQQATGKPVYIADERSKAALK